MKYKFYWHIHHHILLEPLTEPLENRIEYIKLFKPQEEIAIRLRLLKPVKGKLPVTFVKAWETYYKAREANDKAWEAYDKAGETYEKTRKAYEKAWEAYDKAGETYAEAWEAYYKASEAYVKAGKAKGILTLHKKECGCDWNGETIFAGKNKI